MKLSERVINNILSEVFKYDSVVTGEKETALRHYLESLDLVFQLGEADQAILEEHESVFDGESLRPGWGED